MKWVLHVYVSKSAFSTNEKSTIYQFLHYSWSDKITTMELILSLTKATNLFHLRSTDMMITQWIKLNCGRVNEFFCFDGNMYVPSSRRRHSKRLGVVRRLRRIAWNLLYTVCDGSPEPLVSPESEGFRGQRAHYEICENDVKLGQNIENVWWKEFVQGDWLEPCKIEHPATPCNNVRKTNSVAHPPKPPVLNV